MSAQLDRSQKISFVFGSDIQHFLPEDEFSERSAFVAALETSATPKTTGLKNLNDLLDLSFSHLDVLSKKQRELRYFLGDIKKLL